VRAALEIYERTAVAHGRLAALEDAKEVAFSAAIDDLAGGTSR
jgi:hypothetical protein